MMNSSTGSSEQKSVASGETHLCDISAKCKALEEKMATLINELNEVKAENKVLKKRLAEADKKSDEKAKFIAELESLIQKEKQRDQRSLSFFSPAPS